VHHPDDAPADQFRVEVRRGEDHEVFDGLTTTRRQRNNVVTVVNQRSKLIRLEETARGRRSARATGSQALSCSTAGHLLRTDVVIGASEYVGDSADRTGFAGLETVETVTMVCVPDLMAAYEQGKLDLEQVKAVQLAMIAHCELMGDRMAILDPPPGLNAQQIREWRVDVAGYDSKYAALYWPQVKVFDPLSGQSRFMPPSGHVAGHVGPQRRAARRAQGARATRCCSVSSTSRRASPEASTTC
jgi:phage tail sheath protein FI